MLTREQLAATYPCWVKQPGETDDWYLSLDFGVIEKRLRTLIRENAGRGYLTNVTIEFFNKPKQTYSIKPGDYKQIVGLIKEVVADAKLKYDKVRESKNG